MGPPVCLAGKENTHGWVSDGVVLKMEKKKGGEMTPIQSLKQRVLEHRGSRMIGVNVGDLYNLIDDYEKMDSELRVRHGERVSRPVSHILHDVITAAFYDNGKNADKIFFEVANCLSNLVKECRKSHAIYNNYNRLNFNP